MDEDHIAMCRTCRIAWSPHEPGMRCPRCGQPPHDLESAEESADADQDDIEGWLFLEDFDDPIPPLF